MLDGLSELREALNKEGAELRLYAGEDGGTMHADMAVPGSIWDDILKSVEAFAKEELKALGGESD
jgi:hypothetical protein